ncbi:hypothetical protein [Microbacterium invictum]|uniref:Uncharacterized protein n=1 Tax=Microbacterium invictum TaxID=515415 RepID=A0ABZ0VB56_9MICO|nr:hypothetical protein [Microbacterium invictum]WQB70871.1 hypothetical protein T9R20_02620 [Microbacterium invictum]
MQSSRDSWKWLNAEVLRFLSELDPYGLTPGAPDGAPFDEYDTEAIPIASILQRDGTVTAEQIDAVWQKWFGEPLTAVVGSENVDKLIAELTSLSGRRH